MAQDQDDGVPFDASAWVIALPEVESPAPAVEPQFDEVPPALLRFPTDAESFPSEGHHPRLFRFGRLAG